MMPLSLERRSLRFLEIVYCNSAFWAMYFEARSTRGRGAISHFRFASTENLGKFAAKR